VRTGFDVFDGPCLAEIIKLVFELRSTITVDDDRHAVCIDEESDEISDLLCSCVFTTLEDMGET
jgi:hypothetical protein